MAKHLTDREKKKIIADYVELESYNAVAKKHNVSATTVKNTVLKNNESVKKCDKKKDDVCSIISLYLSELQNSDKLQRASIQSIATSLGIVIDKFTKDAQKQSDTSLFDAIAKAAGGFKVE